MGGERVLEGFPGVLDGVDCSHDRGGLCYVAIPSTVSAPVSAVFALPPLIGRVVRTLLMMMPRGWAPAVQPYGGVAEIRLGGGDDPAARITRIFQDPDGTDFSTITGVTERGGKLYLGCLHCDYVGVVSLD